MSTPVVTPDQGQTVLDRCADEIKRRLEAMQLEGTDTGSLWNGVFEGSIVEKSNDTYPVVGFEFGTEEVAEYLYPLTQKNVPIFIEFRFKRMLDDDRSVQSVYRYYVGRLQAEFTSDDYDGRTLGGLCNNIVETGSNPEIEGPEDPAPGGVLMLSMQYEHVTGNPYKTREDLSHG